MNISRRRALSLLGLGATPGPALAQTPLSLHRGPVRFLHGVASGDPDRTSGVFWTRVTVPEGVTADVDLELQIAADPDFRRLARRAPGLRAARSRDWTVKHDLDGRGLRPGTEYWYRFRAAAGGELSPVGRFRTLPDRTPDLVLAVVSCALHPGGLFNAYDAIGGLERLDAVVHRGDRIY